MAVHPLRRGVVTDFGDHRGTGVVRGEDGVELGFHCTRIDDGTRTIVVGTPVVFEVGPGPGPGTWEATTVVRALG